MARPIGFKFSHHLIPPRNLEHSTILYEDPKQLPLLRLSWNKQDPNYLATFAMESSEVLLQCIYMYCVHHV